MLCLSYDFSDETPRTTRNAGRTRTNILAAAATAMVEHGTGVSLEYIAKQAGISKSGLFHHYPNREALIVALVDGTQEQFRENVLKHLDISENKPGKLLRAYVRALTSGSEATIQYFTAAPIWAGVYRIPEVVQITKSDDQWWAENFAADGLSSDRILIIRRAAEGLAIAVAYGEENQASIDEGRELLLRLADGGEFGSSS